WERYKRCLPETRRILNKRWRSVYRWISFLMGPNAAYSVHKIPQSNKRNIAVKKDHTVKNNLIIDMEERLVRYLSQTFAGRIHDKRICDEEDYTFPPGCVLFKDTGFQGCEPENVITYQPQKKPRNHELSAEEKAENQLISSIRILVEHVIASVKRCRIVHDV